MNMKDIDQKYQSFPDFITWKRDALVNQKKMEKWLDRINEIKESPKEEFQRAIEVVKRAASWDTGALERLYETDHSFTITVANSSNALQKILEEKGEEAKNLFEAQLDALQFILDLAIQEPPRAPISEASIRALHQKICASQDTYEVIVEVDGNQIKQKQSLPKGEYKKYPNHVLNRYGEIHAYSPVAETGREMNKLVNEFRKDEFIEADVILQASYAHYAFILIHPFADGNGRVARALANIFAFRSLSFPIVFFNDRRREYLESLHQADSGNLTSFSSFVLTCLEDTVLVIQETMDKKVDRDTRNLVSSIEKIYLSKGGFPHKKIDEAGASLFDEFYSRLEKYKEEVVQRDGNIQMDLKCSKEDVKTHENTEGYRWVLPEAKSIQIYCRTEPPAEAEYMKVVLIEIPLDADVDDLYIIRDRESDFVFEVRIPDVLAGESNVLRSRMEMAVDRLFVKILERIYGIAKQKLRQNGYTQQ